MLKNYLKTALRRLLKYRLHSIINILGLAIGISVFLIIMIYVFYEISADEFHQNYTRIYRVDLNEKFGITSITLMQRILDGVPELENGTRLMPYSGKVEYNENRIDSRLTFVDSTFFDIFSFEPLIGDLTSALNDPNSIVLLESFAEKLFGDDYPIGKEIQFFMLNLTVRAVVKDPQHRTQLWAREGFVPFINLKTLGEDFENDWWGNYVTYLLFPENCDHPQLIKKVESYIEELKKIIHENYPSYILRPFSKLYFEQGKYDHSVHGNLQSVRIFLASAFIIILIACINFINLSTSRAILRAKEIGIRKIVGADRKSVILQFLIESVLTCIISGIFAVILIQIFYPQLSIFFRINYQLNTFLNYLIFGLFLLLIGIVAGIYPAFCLASGVPVEVIKNEYKTGVKGVLFRKILTVIQFSISIILIIGTFIVLQQLYYIRNVDMGFDKEQVMSFSIPPGVRDNKRELFKQELLKIPGVKKVAYIYTVPGRVVLQWGYHDQEGNEYYFRTIPTDPDFVSVYNIDIVAGRNFSWELETDRDNFLVNETFVRQMGWEDPIGRELYEGTQVIGVVEDFIYRSLHNEIEPLIIPFNWDNTYSVNIRVDDKDQVNTINRIQNVYEEFEKENNFEYFFLDDDFNLLYRSEIRFGKIFIFFSTLSIFIACMGLFGLSSFLTYQRTREIGIRKVMGSSVRNIVFILSREFSRNVLLANLLAWPIAYFIMKNWLQNFSFRINLTPLPFIIAGFLAFIIALLTVSFQTIKAANANPIECLRYE